MVSDLLNYMELIIDSVVSSVCIQHQASMSCPVREAAHLGDGPSGQKHEEKDASEFGFNLRLAQGSSGSLESTWEIPQLRLMQVVLAERIQAQAGA